MDNTITVREANNVSRKNNDCLVVCPCCSRWVTKTNARSIFDFNVKICKRCALAEKLNSNFNWILENEITGEKRKCGS